MPTEVRVLSSSRNSFDPDDETINNVNSSVSSRTGYSASYSVRPDQSTSEEIASWNMEGHEKGALVWNTTTSQNQFWDGEKWIPILSEEELQDSVKEDIQGYYAVISNYYSADAAVKAGNPVVEVIEDVWTKLEVQPLVELDESPDSTKSIGIFNSTTNTFTLAGLDAGSNIIMRTLVRLRPDVDGGAASLRLNFTPNVGPQFQIESQLFNMTKGADVDYQDESIITAFAGSNLAGNTIAEAGSFIVEVNSTVDTDVEVLAFTLYINK